MLKSLHRNIKTLKKNAKNIRFFDLFFAMVFTDGRIIRMEFYSDSNENEENKSEDVLNEAYVRGCSFQGRHVNETFEVLRPERRSNAEESPLQKRHLKSLW